MVVVYEKFYNQTLEDILTLSHVLPLNNFRSTITSRKKTHKFSIYLLA